MTPEQANIILETVSNTVQRVRNEALEEAARCADGFDRKTGSSVDDCARGIAAAIRALK